MNRKDRARNILNTTALGQCVSHEDYVWLMSEVFPNHPFFDVKTHNKKITAVKVDQSPQHPTRCFYLVRGDGTKTDISLTKCFTKPQDEIRMACRTAVKPIIQSFRNRIRYPYTCPLSGRELHSPSEVDVDHYDMTFDELYKLWLKTEARGINIQLEGHGDNQSEVRFTDEQITQNFIKFHNEHTHLRAIDAHLNRSRKCNTSC